MDLTELFKDALSYPTKSIDKWLILGVLLILVKLGDILNGFNFLRAEILDSWVLIFILAIVSILAALIAYGYALSIIRNTIHNVDDEIAPEFDLQRNIIDGLKLFVLGIVYFIIPFIITLITALASGAFYNIYKLLPYVSNGTAYSVPEALLVSTAISFAIPLLIGFVFFIAFCILYTIAKAVLADTGSLTAACNMPEVFKKVGEIGWGNYIIWLIVLFIILFIIALFSGVISAIPFIGLIIATLAISSFVEMFGARALGLLYNGSKNKS